MAAYYYPMYPADFLPPLVDHVHERPHPHRNLLQVLTRQSQHEPEPNQPDVDIRDAFTEYLIEVDVPGVEDAKSISVVWSSNRHLVISGTIKRPHSKGFKHVTTASTTGTRDAEGIWQAPVNDKTSAQEDPHFPTLLVNERRIGPFRRYFNFPVDMDMEKLEAKLTAGVLNIKIPKKVDDGGKAGKAEILS